MKLKLKLTLALLSIALFSTTTVRAHEGGSSTQGSSQTNQTGNAMFTSADTDGNGTLSLTEFKASVDAHRAQMKQQLGDKYDASRAAQMPSAEDMFKKIDTNADGAISLDEMNASHKNFNNKGGQGGQGGGQSMFTDADSNSDGKVSLSEFKACVEAHRTKMKEQKGDSFDTSKLPSPDDMFKRMDANADGYLSESEMQSGHK